jgi:hypothetical protein
MPMSCIKAIGQSPCTCSFYLCVKQAIMGEVYVKCAEQIGDNCSCVVHGIIQGEFK